MSTRNTIILIWVLVLLIAPAVPVAAYRGYRYTPAGVHVPKVERTYGMPEPTTEAEGFDLLGGVFEAVGGLFTALFGGPQEPVGRVETVPPERLAMARQEYIEYPNASGIVVRMPRDRVGRVARIGFE